MYYLKKNGKVFGPFPLEKLQGMVAKGRIQPENSISEDRSNWVEASHIKELFPELAGSEAIFQEQKTSEEPPPMVNLQEEIKVKPKVKQPDKKESYVEKMQPPSDGGRLDTGKNEEAVLASKPPGVLSLFWNPVYALPEICEKKNKSKFVRASSIFIALNSTFFYSGNMSFRFDT